MADVADMANDRIEQEMALQAKARQIAHDQQDDCEDCGQLISSERQLATGGTIYCVDCAGLREQKARMYR